MILEDYDNRLDGSVAGRAAFARYTDAFSKGDCNAFTAFYAPDIVLKLASLNLVGQANIISFYRNMYRCVREHLTVHRVIADDAGIFAEMTATFTAHADAPDFLVGPLRAGEKIAGHMFIVYRLADGKITEIQTARVAPMGAPTPA